jgi:hypothetical protein
MERARAFDEVTVIIERVARWRIPRRVVRTVSDYWHGIVRTAAFPKVDNDLWMTARSRTAPLQGNERHPLTCP